MLIQDNQMQFGISLCNFIYMSQGQTQSEAKSLPEKQQNKQINIIETNPEINSKKSPNFDRQQSQLSLRQKLLIDEQDDDPELKAYFKSKITLNDRNKSMAINLVDQKMQNLKDNIKEGLIVFPEKKKSINQIINKSSPIARQEEKLNEYMQQKNQLEKELKRMEEAIQSSSGDAANSNHSPKRREAASLSPQQHKKFIERITIIKKQIQQRRKMKADYEENRMKELQKKEQQMMKDKQQKQLNQKRNQAKERLQLIIKRRQKMKEEEMESKKRFKSVLQQKRLHHQMEEQYQKSMFLPMIDQRNKILQERSKQLRSIKVEDIQEYQKQYLKNRQERQSNSRNKINENWSYKPPARSSKMIRILEEEKILEKIKEEQQKRRLQELRSRQQGYKQYLKERFSSVRIDQKKRLEISTIIAKEKSIKERPSEALARDKGIKYLDQLKSKIKSPSKDKKQCLSTNEEEVKKSKIRQTYHKKPKTSMSNYEASSTSSIKTNKVDQIIASSSITENEKRQKLQLELARLSDRTQRKQQLQKHNKKTKGGEEDLDDLLNSIKAKMSIIELYQK